MDKIKFLNNHYLLICSLAAIIIFGQKESYAKGSKHYTIMGSLLPIYLEENQPASSIYKVWQFKEIIRVHRTSQGGAFIGSRINKLDFTKRDTVIITEKDSTPLSAPYKIVNDELIILYQEKVPTESEVSFGQRIEKLTENELILVVYIKPKEGREKLSGDIIKLVFQAKKK